MTREEAINEIKSWDFLEGKEIEAIQVLVPELCENDNERIRKDIINYIGFEKPIADKDENRIKEMITYLERQKEQDKCPKYCVRSHCIGCSIYENQKEQKEETLRDFIDNFPYSEKQKEQNPEKKHVVTRDFTSTDAIESCMLRYLQSAANRKDDIEIIEDTKKYKKQLLEIVKQKEQKPSIFPPGFGEVRWNPISSVQQKPSEWSEEDETHRAFILESLEDQIRFCKKDAEGAYCAKQIRTAQNWLKSLCPKPKQEWSDKDEHILNNIYDFVAENTIDINRAPCAKECLDWLKSLRPQQKQELTEEEKNKYVFDTLCALGYPIDANGNIIKYEETFEMCKNTMAYWLQQNLQKMIARKMVDSEGIKTQTLLKESYLKAYREGVEDSIRELLLQYNKKSPQPSWKPTEEQIKAIRLARSFVVDDFSEEPTLSETLKELEEQLKKL